MKILRKLILKTGIVFLICFSVLIAFCNPMKASEPAYSFANWLQKESKIKLPSRVTQNLTGLYQSNLDSSTILRQAEKILIQNDDSPELLKGLSPETIHQYVLVKWNLFKTGKDMNAVSADRINKRSDSPSYLNLLSGGANKLLRRNEGNHAFKTNVKKTSNFLLRKQVTPLVDEISIGAP